MAKLGGTGRAAKKQQRKQKRKSSNGRHVCALTFALTCGRQAAKRAGERQVERGVGPYRMAVPKRWMANHCSRLPQPREMSNAAIAAKCSE